MQLISDLIKDTEQMIKETEELYQRMRLIEKEMTEK